MESYSVTELLQVCCSVYVLESHLTFHYSLCDFLALLPSNRLYVYFWSFRGRREDKWGSFRGRFGDHIRVGDHFGVGIILGSGSFWGLYSSPHKGSAQRRFAPLQKSPWNHLSYVGTETPLVMALVPARKLSGAVWTYSLVEDQDDVLLGSTFKKRTLGGYKSKGMSRKVFLENWGRGIHKLR